MSHQNDYFTKLYEDADRLLLVVGSASAAKSGLSPRTVLHIHRLLRKALQQAVIWQVRPTNPAAMIQAPRAKDKEMKPVEEDRAGWLIEAAENTDLYLPILTALYTGMRRGEILGLRWTDLDLDNARLTVKQSLGQTRAGIHFKKPRRSARMIHLCSLRLTLTKNTICRRARN